MPGFIESNLDILACPACAAALQPAGTAAAVCSGCALHFPSDDAIPLLFHPHTDDRRDVTEIVKEFYETQPFPNYDDTDSAFSLREKAKRGIFARLLDEQIPDGALVLEAGCGTGQLSNFLGTHWNRRVVGSDLCLNSLRLAEDFRRRSAIENVGFLQMNLFRPAFRAEVFDLVVSNGVLHHTSDPAGGFASIARLVKPGGIVIVGLYNTVGRLTTDVRSGLMRVVGSGLGVATSMRRGYNEGRRRAWIMDQFKHPHESRHTYDEVLGWFKREGVEFLSGIPHPDQSSFRADERLFSPHSPGTRLSRLMVQIQMLLTGGRDGALFLMMGRKLVPAAAKPVAQQGHAAAT